jgi:cation diffusion facilitator family transporter
MMNIETKVREKKIYTVTIIGSFVNFVLLILKLFIGIKGNSKALVADAVHTLSDFLTDFVVIFFVKIANKPQDKDHNYGHAKYETLASLIIGIILFLVGIGIAYNSIVLVYKITHGEEYAGPGVLVLVMSIIGLIAKELLYQYTIVQGKKLKSEALIANAWHHRSDALSSVGTTIGIAGAILLGHKWTILDPLSALVVSYIIIIMGIKIAKKSIDELLEISLSDEVKTQITNLVYSHEDVADLHNFRTRKIGSSYAIEFHIRMDGNLALTDAHDRITEIENKLKDLYGVGTHVNIHVEPKF